MRFLSLIATVGVLAGLAPTFAMAQVGPGADGLLPAPPSDARPGECFAKVIVPGEPIAPPPAQPHAAWILTPGVAGPMWCLQFLPGPQQPIRFTPERHGWIRVICDKDATPERIRHIQHRLHDWGYYNGGYDGKYDKGVGAAVTRFQAREHIAHGGYLSYRTMEALDGQIPSPPPPPPARITQGAAYGGQVGYGPGAGGQFYAPPVYQAPIYQPPCGPACLPPPPQPCCVQASGYPGAPYKRWLNWSGKINY